MRRSHHHRETHQISKLGWLRAAVLGANDGIVSTASLIMGVAAAAATQHNILIAGIAALVAGAMSMAAGEYVSVSTQSDSEAADLAKEKRELKEEPRAELEELRRIYISRGLDADLAQKVAVQLTHHDALGAHARDELGISETTVARPIQAAFASAASFSTGAALPLLVVLCSPRTLLLPLTGAASLVFLAVLGVLSAKTGGSSPVKATVRVVFWGAFAMAVTAGVGSLFGAPAA
jgi:VIT1/CCC1 family predicted Fe2+/Mn2+ transporter